jgi:chemotaxis protein MotB
LIAREAGGFYFVACVGARIRTGGYRRSTMPREAKIVACILTTVLAFVVLGVAFWNRGEELRDARRQGEQTLAVLRRTESALAGQQTQFTALTSIVTEARVRIQSLEAEKARLAREKDAIAQTQQNLENEMRRALESKDITISELQGKLTVNILDRVLFDSGEATLKPEGELVLRRVAEVLAQYPNRQIHVIGHTDNVPIKATARVKFASNWELSTARATAAVRFLSEQAGVDARRLGAVGYGEFHPVADNATPEGRAKNRRIALVVLSEELAGSDAAVLRLAPQAAAATNAAPDSVNTNTAPPAP